MARRPSCGLPRASSASAYFAAAAAQRLDTAEAHAKAEESACQAKLQNLSMDIEKWARRKREAPNKDAVERERELAWAEENRAENEAALREMRSFLPVDLGLLTFEQLEERVAQASAADLAGGSRAEGPFATGPAPARRPRRRT